MYLTVLLCVERVEVNGKREILAALKLSCFERRDNFFPILWSDHTTT